MFPILHYLASWSPGLLSLPLIVKCRRAPTTSCGRKTPTPSEGPILASPASLDHSWDLHSHIVPHALGPAPPYQHILSSGGKSGGHAHRDALVSLLRGSPN